MKIGRLIVLLFLGWIVGTATAQTGVARYISDYRIDSLRTKELRLDIDNLFFFKNNFYDRFLRDFKGTSVGLVHSELLVPYLPRDEHDTLLCTIATEKGIFKIQ